MDDSCMNELDLTKCTFTLSGVKRNKEKCGSHMLISNIHTPLFIPLFFYEIWKTAVPFLPI